MLYVCIYKTTNQFRKILSARLANPKMLALALLLVLVTAGSQTLANKSEDFFIQTNNKHKVVIWTKTKCVSCLHAKVLFRKLDQHFTVVEIDLRADYKKMRKVLEKHTGAKHVPKIYVKGKYIGDYQDIQELKNDGSLQELLED